MKYINCPNCGCKLFEGADGSHISKGLIMREKSSGKEIEIVAEETHENTKAGDIVFTMPSGYMYDQKQMRSDNVYYQLQEITRGE